MSRATEPITRILYREAIDYSEILLNRGIIDRSNAEALKANIQRGKEFTNKDLDWADSIDPKNIQKLSDAKAANKIEETLIRMEGAKKNHPRMR